MTLPEALVLIFLGPPVAFLLFLLIIGLEGDE